MRRVDGGYLGTGQDALELFVRHENYVRGFPGFMFRRREWEVRPVDESYSVAADFDFLCGLCARGSVVFVPETHYLRREHRSNLSHQDEPRLVDVIRILVTHLGEEATERADCRYALAGKVLLLASGLRRAGHLDLADRLDAVVNTLTDGVRWKARWSALRVRRPVAVDLPRSDAARWVHEVESLLTNVTAPGPPGTPGRPGASGPDAPRPRRPGDRAADPR
jgi:hypothetical protein